MRQISANPGVAGAILLAAIIAVMLWAWWPPGLLLPSGAVRTSRMLSYRLGAADGPIARMTIRPLSMLRTSTPTTSDTRSPVA